MHEPDRSLPPNASAARSPGERTVARRGPTVAVKLPAAADPRMILGLARRRRGRLGDRSCARMPTQVP